MLSSSGISLDDQMWLGVNRTAFRASICVFRGRGSLTIPSSPTGLILLWINCCRALRQADRTVAGDIATRKVDCDFASSDGYGFDMGFSCGTIRDGKSFP